MICGFKRWKYFEEWDILVGIVKCILGIKLSFKSMVFVILFILFWFIKEDLMGRKFIKEVKSGFDGVVKNIVW